MTQFFIFYTIQTILFFDCFSFEISITKFNLFLSFDIFTPPIWKNRLISKSLLIFMKSFRHFDILLILMNVPAPLENCRFNGKCSFNLYYAVLSVQGWSTKACIQKLYPNLWIAMRKLFRIQWVEAFFDVYILLDLHHWMPL